jgi:hypothetical protein
LTPLTSLGFQCDRASLFLLDHKTGELLLQGGAHAMPRGCVPS